MVSREGAIGLVVLLLCSLWAQPIVNAVISDHTLYIDAVSRPGQEGEVHFDKPLFFWTTKPMHMLAGNLTFTFAPLLFFGLSCLIMCSLFARRNVQQRWIAILLLVNVAWVGSLLLFMRDSLLFFQAVCFLWAMETQHRKLALFFALAAPVTKVGGILLIFFWLWPYIRPGLKRLRGFPLIISYPEWLHGTLFNEKMALFWGFLRNPICALALLRPTVHSVSYAVAVAVIAANGYSLSHIYRYTLFLMPFAMFSVAQMSENNRWMWLLLLLVAVISNLYLLSSSETVQTIGWTWLP